MALSIYYFYDLFDEIYKIYTPKSVAVIGSLVISPPIKILRKELKIRYNTTYTDFDINGLADIKIDLTKPLPEKFRNKYDLIIDSGTIEHIFDQYNVFKNIYDMCIINGCMLFIEPFTTPMGHSFYRYDRKFFIKLAQVNKSEILMDYIINVNGDKQYINRKRQIEKGTQWINHLFLIKKTRDGFNIPMG